MRSTFKVLFYVKKGSEKPKRQSASDVPYHGGRRDLNSSVARWTFPPTTVGREYYRDIKRQTEELKSGSGGIAGTERNGTGRA